MQAKLYIPEIENPVAILDHVQVIGYNDNHKNAPTRIFYKSQSLNAGKKMLEMHRDEKMVIRLDDGRSANVLLQHNSMDSTGNAVGVFRVLGQING